MTGKLLNYVSTAKLKAAIQGTYIHARQCRKSATLIVTILIKLMKLSLTRCALDLLFCNHFLMFMSLFGLEHPAVSAGCRQTRPRCLTTVNSSLLSHFYFQKHQRQQQRHAPSQRDAIHHCKKEAGSEYIVHYLLPSIYLLTVKL